ASILNPGSSLINNSNNNNNTGSGQAIGNLSNSSSNNSNNNYSGYDDHNNSSLQNMNGNAVLVDGMPQQANKQANQLNTQPQIAAGYYIDAPAAHMVSSANAGSVTTPATSTAAAQMHQITTSGFQLSNKSGS